MSGSLIVSDFPSLLAIVGGIGGMSEKWLKVVGDALEGVWEGVWRMSSCYPSNPTNYTNPSNSSNPPILPILPILLILPTLPILPILPILTL